MATRAQIVAEARTWLGTPFVHNGRVKNVGVDCAGVIEMAPKAHGLYSEVSIAPYSPRPDPAKMVAVLLEHLDPIPFRDLKLADVLHFRIAGSPQHLGLVSVLAPLTIIHAWNRKGLMKCVESRVDEFFRRQLAGCYRYRRLED